MFSLLALFFILCTPTPAHESKSAVFLSKTYLCLQCTHWLIYTALIHPDSHMLPTGEYLRAVTWRHFSVMIRMFHDGAMYHPHFPGIRCDRVLVSCPIPLRYLYFFFVFLFMRVLAIIFSFSNLLNDPPDISLSLWFLSLLVCNTILCCSGNILVEDDFCRAA